MPDGSIKPPLVNQPSAMPTRKGMAAAIAGVLTRGALEGLAYLSTMAPAWLQWINAGEVRNLVPILAAGVAFYFVRDRQTT